MRRNDKDALDGVLALPRFGGALLLYGACRVAQGKGGEEYECEGRITLSFLPGTVVSGYGRKIPPA
jgi:hypothetical protein